VTKGISKKLQREDMLRKKRFAPASGLPQGAATPSKLVTVASVAKRASAGLAPHRYPSKKASLGLRQVPPLVAVAPLGRADK
jgi:hypothetical protein